MTEDDILNAAAVHLTTLSPRPHIVWENQTWQGEDHTLLIVETVPHDPFRRGLGGTHEFTGVFQVSVRVLSNTGSDEALTVARRVQNHFYNAVLAGARVNHFPHRLSGYPDGATHYRMPVQVRYQGFMKPA